MDFSNFKEFHCTICGKLFDSDGRCPKMLSCGHSFCLACLNKIFPFCKSCPTCRTDIQFSSVDLIPVNLLIRSCVSKIDNKSGVKRKDISEINETENPSSLDIGCDAKRKKLLSVGFCNEHEKFNELRCMNCEIWICSMCATLNHKKCDTLLVEEAFIEIQKKNYEIIASQLDVRKSKLAKVFKSLNAVKEKKKTLELDIVDLKLKIEAKLDQIKDQDIEFDKLQAVIVEEKKMCAKLKEIQLLTQSSLNVENLEKLLEAKTRLDTLSQQLKSDQDPGMQVPHTESQVIPIDVKGNTPVAKYCNNAVKSSKVPDTNKVIPVYVKGNVPVATKIVGFAVNTVWNSGRVLIAGDSRVQTLQSVPEPSLAHNVDFAFAEGIIVEDLIALVDEKLTNEHKIVILLGFVGDKVEKYSHNVTADNSVTLIRSRECDPSSNIIKAVQTAHARWMNLMPDRIIVWTLPYYIDYLSCNSAKVGIYVGDTVAISWDSSLRFVRFINSLRLQWESVNPNITFSPLNEALFHGKNYRLMYKSFGSVTGEHFRFPSNLLTDGLHPNSRLPKLVWTFLSKAIFVVQKRNQITN